MTKYHIGIDIAKSIHYASILSTNGEVIGEAFPFENTIDGFKVLLSKVPTSNKEQLLFGMESTAHYSNNLSNYLLTQGYTVGIINPLQTCALRKTRIRNTKNDKIDSMIICEALSLNMHKLLSKHENMDELYELCKIYNDIMTKRSRAKIQLVTYIDKIFPELAKFFKGNLHINTSYEVLKKYTTPLKIVKARIDSLTNLMTSASHGRYKKSKALELKELASNTVGIENSSIEFKILLVIEQIELYTKQLEEIKEQIVLRVDSLDSPIMSIPGIGHLQAATILSSIKDITLFSKPCKVLAFAGLDPTVRQSGNFNARSTRMSKRGSSALRYSLIMSSMNVVKNNKTFNDYYELKRSNGKSHYNALGHVSHKLIRVIYKLLTENIKFELA